MRVGITVVCGQGGKCGRMRAKEAGKKMTKRIEVAAAPAPLEEYAQHFDGLFGKSNQREGFRRYVEGLLLPGERHKTLTGLTNTEPVVGAQLPRAQRLQWFLSESDWDERDVQAERLRLLRQDAASAPTAKGVLVIDETGDRKDGHNTAHVSRQYLANLGKIDNGVVSVSSLWADEGVYYPVDVEPYTPAVYEASGKQDPAFRTKLVLARQLVERAIGEGLPFRAMVADSFYGEDRTLRQELRTLGVPYVMALKPSHAWWHPEDVAGTLQDVAHEAGWVSAQQPGKWVRIVRTIRSGSTQEWWVLEIVAGPYGPDKTERAVVATTDPESLPDLTTWNRLAVSCRQFGRGDQTVRAAHVGRAELQAGQTRPRLVTVPGQKRHSHSTALAVSLVCVLLLLVSCLSPLAASRGRGPRAIRASSSSLQQ